MKNTSIIAPEEWEPVELLCECGATFEKKMKIKIFELFIIVICFLTGLTFIMLGYMIASTEHLKVLVEVTYQQKNCEIIGYNKIQCVDDNYQLVVNYQGSEPEISKISLEKLR